MKKRPLTDINAEMTQMLELSDRDFKGATIKRLQRASMNLF